MDNGSSKVNDSLLNIAAAFGVGIIAHAISPWLAAMLYCGLIAFVFGKMLGESDSWRVRFDKLVATSGLA